MKISRIGAVAALAATAALALSSCASNESGNTGASSPSGEKLKGTISGVGSSAQQKAQEAWYGQFGKDNGDVTINYDPQGSGAGRKAFIAGGAVYAGSDAALTDEELKSTFAGCADGSKAIDLPVYISPIVLAYHVDGVKDLKLDAQTTAGIFAGQIKTWDDPKIKALNPDAKLPSANITAVHRADDSGTTQNFTDYLAQNAKDVWTKPAAQTFPADFGGEAAQKTSGVADTISKSANAIGYIDESGKGSLDVAEVKVGDKFVKPSADGAAATVAKSPMVDGRESNDLAVKIDRTLTDSSTYPIVLVSYMITCDKYKDSNVSKIVKAYADYVVSEDGQKLAQEKAGSAPLASDLASKVKKAIESIK